MCRDKGQVTGDKCEDDVKGLEAQSENISHIQLLLVACPLLPVTQF